MQSEVIFIRGNQCTCLAGATVQPDLHDPECAWRQQSKKDLAKDHFEEPRVIILPKEHLDG